MAKRLNKASIYIDIDINLYIYIIDIDIDIDLSIYLYLYIYMYILGSFCRFRFVSWLVGNVVGGVCLFLLYFSWFLSSEVGLRETAACQTSWHCLL